jgi:hypothetical protein
LPDVASFVDNALPVALYQNRNNARIVAQRGVFTLHGTKDVPIDKLIRTAAGEDCAGIAAVRVQNDGANEIIRQLRALGLDQSVAAGNTWRTLSITAHCAAVAPTASVLKIVMWCRVTATLAYCGSCRSCSCNRSAPSHT